VNGFPVASQGQASRDIGVAAHPKQLPHRAYRTEDLADNLPWLWWSNIRDCGSRTYDLAKAGTDNGLSPYQDNHQRNCQERCNRHRDNQGYHAYTFTLTIFRMM
jgi:hypothetical protein